MGRAPLPPGSCGSRSESGGRDRGETPCPGVVRVALGCCAVYRAPSPSTTRLSIVQRAFLVEVAGNRRLLPGLAAVGCRRGGAGGAPGTIRGGIVSESVAKARIESERTRRIVDIPHFHPRPIPARGAFATDLDNCPARVVPGAPPAPLRSDFIRTMSKSDPSKELRGATTPRAGGLTRRTCVCYASFRLLRSFTLQCTRKWSVVEGEGA